MSTICKCTTIGPFSLIFGIILIFLFWRVTPKQTVVGKESRVQLKAGANFSTSAHKCPTISLADPKFKPFFKSQSGEDQQLMKWFNGLCGGTYMEMGGLDGITFSNTYFFNKAPEISWKGVLVELGPENFKKLVKNRPDELATVHAAVCESPRTLHYIEAGAVGGIWEFAASTFRERWWKGRTIESAIEIECLPLQEILDTHLNSMENFYFDFFSLDIEGAEFEALQSLDYERVGFGVILCEADAHNELKNMALRTFLADKGYIFLENKDRSYWFVNGQFGHIYGKLLHS
jgi:hypothetical protein